MILLVNTQANIKNKKVGTDFDFETVEILKKVSRKTGIPVAFPELKTASKKINIDDAEVFVNGTKIEGAECLIDFSSPEVNEKPATKDKFKQQNYEEGN